MPDQEMIPVTVAALVEDQGNMSPIVILHHQPTDRILPIWIGDPEARAVALALNRVKLERPLTHNLILNTIKGVGGKLLYVVVNKLEKSTYFAQIAIKVAEKTTYIDARPSDSIALALTADIPIFIRREVMDVASQPNPVRGFIPEPETPVRAEVKPGDVKKLRDMLQKAREREEESWGGEEKGEPPRQDF